MKVRFWRAVPDDAKRAGVRWCTKLKCPQRADVRWSGGWCARERVLLC